MSALEITPFQTTSALRKRVYDPRQSSLRNGPRIVAIGGGTGLPIVLQGMKHYTSHITAVVGVTDAGRSSGDIRRKLHLPPPGDIRNCLIALSRSETLVHDLFQYRFTTKELQGMNFGNLFIAALAKVTGSFQKSVEATSKILAIQGMVVPSTYNDIQLCARLSNGKIIIGDDRIAQRLAHRRIARRKRYPKKSPTTSITSVFLKPRAKAAPGVCEAIARAEIIILGPGTLYSSIITNLLVDGIPQAIRQAKATKIYVCNIMTQPGQTDGFSWEDHLRVVEQYVGKNVIDVIIVNTMTPPLKIIREYQKEGKRMVTGDMKTMKTHGVTLVAADVIEIVTKKRLLWEKDDMLRHDPQKLAKIIMRVMKKQIYHRK